VTEPTFEQALYRIRGLVNFRAICGPVYEHVKPAQPERPQPRKRGRSRGVREQLERKPTGDYWWKLCEAGSVPFESAEEAREFAASVQDMLHGLSKPTRQHLADSIRQSLEVRITTGGLEQVYHLVSQMRQLCLPWVQVATGEDRRHVVVPTADSTVGMLITGAGAAEHANRLTDAINQSLSESTSPLLDRWQETALRLAPVA
jgi:hypothetical protein